MRDVVNLPEFGPASGVRGILARWIHEYLAHSTLYFFPTYWAFNIGWHERPERTIKSYAEPASLFTP